MKKNFVFYACIFILLLINTLNSEETHRDYKNDEIFILKILLFRGDNIHLGFSGKMNVEAGENKKDYYDSIYIIKRKNTVLINNNEYYVPIRISADISSAFFSFNNKKYRGCFIVDMEKDEMLLINQINLEEYLYGVIKSEIPSSWPSEAIKAQIIAGRTYAFFKKKLNKNQKYYLESTTAFQVYGGYNSESFFTNQMVDITKGIIITYQQEPIEAIYHSSCGGYTEDAKDIWGRDLHYLKGIYSDYCKNTPIFKWEKILTFKEISDMLNKKLKISSAINHVSIGKTINSRRVLTILCMDKNKVQHEISMKDFRLWVGSKDIPSTLFTLKNEKNRVIFKGRGYGHGVGLCQMCSKEMALIGKTYEEILI
ncbi:SpoIID/LytB domain-containing protein [Candidatus Desantisbacteria bacterium]|nr:SpoIID/LytB domain-containing protein [Candidatus Desantisbacteria bacterium]